MTELTSTVEKRPNQTTIRISGYLSGDHGVPGDRLHRADSQKVFDFDEECFH